ncbi:Sec-independent protein translocase protein TatB [Acuticoccus sediminis]|uniref:Sec-independent protein translocase protein TatB n=1 Tax=Acuticoccus sediminis TaxID=2184697 RepID=UPI001CFCFA76|nr:Sec-independent protein translocase protein TatB [Acuticoccus sediminis]
MFDIGWSEILVVAVIAIIVVGPKELPGMLRAFGKTFGQVRRTAREFQNTFNDALREAERQANLEDVRKDIESVRALDPTKALRKSLDDTKKQLSGKIDTGTTGSSAASKDGAPAVSDVVPLKNPDPAATDAPRPQPAVETPPAAVSDGAASAAPAAETPSTGGGDGEARRTAAAGGER